MLNFSACIEMIFRDRPFLDRIDAVAETGLKAVEEIRPGDVVWFAPNEKHWHGATPTTAMSDIAIKEALNGKMADWMEKVTDDQYMKS